MDMDGSLPFSKAFGYASEAISNRFTNPFWKLKEFFCGTRLRQSIHEVQAYGRIVVAAAVKRRRERKNRLREVSANEVDNSQNHLIDCLLDDITDQQLIADAAMNFLSAGRDTTAQALTWTFYQIMRYPTTAVQIRKELREAIPTAGKELCLSFDAVQPSSLPFTMAVFNEAIRLYPPVPFEIKEATMSTTLPDGTWLPKGAVVLWVMWALGRSTHIWGEDATEFCPERWMERSPEGKVTLMTKGAYEHPVFNAGPRSCLGKKMAETLAVYVIASLIWRYDFEEILDAVSGDCMVGKERVSQNSLTLPMEGGLPCIVRQS